MGRVEVFAKGGGGEIVLIFCLDTSAGLVDMLNYPNHQSTTGCTPSHFTVSYTQTNFLNLQISRLDGIFVNFAAVHINVLTNCIDMYVLSTKGNATNAAAATSSSHVGVT